MRSSLRPSLASWSSATCIAPMMALKNCFRCSCGGPGGDCSDSLGGKSVIGVSYPSKSHHWRSTGISCSAASISLQYRGKLYRASGQVLGMKTVSVTLRTQEAAHRPFRAGVLGTDRLHNAATLLRRSSVHNAPSAGLNHCPPAASRCIRRQFRNDWS